jgi:hypothetical protein
MKTLPQQGPDQTLRTRLQLFELFPCRRQLRVALLIAFCLLDCPVTKPTADLSDDPTIAAHFVFA